MKTILIIIVTLIMALPAYGALTEQEMEMGDGYLAWYRLRASSDVQKQRIFIYGTDAEKRTILKTFVNDVMLPLRREQKTKMDESVARQQAEITDLERLTKD